MRRSRESRPCTARSETDLGCAESSPHARRVTVTDDDPLSIAAARRVEARIAGVTVPVVSREDLILSKLWWRKDTGSELQKRDVESLLATATSLDATYLKRWADHLVVRAQLEELLAR